MIGAAALTAVSAEAAADQTATDEAFAALKGYNYGSSRGALMAIDEAIRRSLGDDRARQELERRLLAVFEAGVSPVAKEYICAKLGLIGSAACASLLAGGLTDKGLSDAVRSALEALPCPEGLKALRASLSRLGARQKVGVLNSLGIRRDGSSVGLLARLLRDSDLATVAAAAAALGNIGTAKAARPLRKFLPQAPAVVGPVVADACLACAERLLAEGQRSEAVTLYQALADSRQPSHVRQAASRGLSLAARKR